MAKYVISFGAGAMAHVRRDEMPMVAEAARAVCREAISAGVFVFAGGLEDQPASVVAPDGTVTSGLSPQAVSGITVVDVPTREEALVWAAKVAVACRCAQEVRAIMPDPDLDEMLSRRSRP